MNDAEGLRVETDGRARFCCPTMQEAWEQERPLFAYRVPDWPDGAGSAVSVVLVETDPGWENGPTENNWAVRFCPFCGRHVSPSALPS